MGEEEKYQMIEDDADALRQQMIKDIGHLLSYSNINEVTIEESKPSSLVKLISDSFSHRRLADIDNIKPVQSLTKLQGLDDRQLSKALSNETTTNHSSHHTLSSIVNVPKQLSESTNLNSLQSEPYNDLHLIPKQMQENKQSYSALNDDKYYDRDEYKTEQMKFNNNMTSYDPEEKYPENILPDRWEGNSNDSGSELEIQPLINMKLMNTTGGNTSINEADDVLLPIVAAKLHYVNGSNPKQNDNNLRKMKLMHPTNTNQNDGGNADDDDENNKDLKLKKTELLMSTNTNGNDEIDTNPQQRSLKKMLSEGPNNLTDDKYQMKETVLMNGANNGPQMAFSKMLSDKTLRQISKDKDKDDSKESSDDDDDDEDNELRSGVALTLLGDAAQNEQIQFMKITNSSSSLKRNKSQSEKVDTDSDDDDVLLNGDDIKTLGNDDENGNQ